MQRESRDLESESSTRRRTLWQALGRLNPYLQGIRLRWTLGLLSAVGAGIVALTIPQVLQVLVNSVLAEGAETAAVWTAAGVILALGMLEAFLFFLRRFFVLPPASDAESAMRTRLFEKLQHLPASFHSAWGAGQLQSRAIADLNLLRRWFAFGSIMFVSSVISVIVGFALMMRLSPLLTVVFLAAAIPIIIYGPTFRTRFVHYSRRAQDQAGDVATSVEESVHGIRVLKAFGRGEHALKGFVRQADRLRGTEVAKARTLARFLLVMITLPETVLGICLLIGLWQVAHEDTTGVTVGALAAFFATAAVLKGPIEGVGMLLGMTFTAKTAIDRHADVMDTTNTITSPAEPIRAPEHGTLELDDVHFRYPDAKPHERDQIDGVSLRIEHGETMALVSHTGGGTSTLLNLIPRLYDVTSGTVRIDGVDVRDFDLADLRSRIAVAFEDPTLFSSSVRANVLLGTAHDRDEDDPQHPDRDGAPRPDQLEEVLARALRTADAEFVEDLPGGVDTAIGEEGLSLSGGQRQRLALARAIAAAPSVLLLDDPLSALDVRTEERVTHRLREVLEGTTTLIVAHRPSTVAMADRVALLHEGRIADVGTHDELLNRSALYRDVMSTSPEAEEIMDSIPAEQRTDDTEADTTGDTGSMEEVSTRG
ncbi:ABC transporter ATP-binding protein [Nesterenkonia sp. HG001]|uniref:ABC transporter ATP-binding protein n=1 Tax=Nesterenkonia sp. HG001 TaxID=2983207 RepID=UPI002AC6C212|nr:ABC transporter ATP-binding protein [Nesterenkonia sp. HG001]MDZ5077087.1 ABC transporter ATP-binding protein/permease [Nesterenkonia sp. HG001]